MASFIPRIFWTDFCKMGGNGGVLSIFINRLWSEHWFHLFILAMTNYVHRMTATQPWLCTNMHFKVKTQTGTSGPQVITDNEVWYFYKDVVQTATNCNEQDQASCRDAACAQVTQSSADEYLVHRPATARSSDQSDCSRPFQSNRLFCCWGAVRYECYQSNSLKLSLLI